MPRRGRHSRVARLGVAELRISLAASQFVVGGVAVAVGEVSGGQIVRIPMRLHELPEIHPYGYAADGQMYLV